MAYDATKMKDWQIAEAAEENMPTPDEFRERLHLEKDEVNFKTSVISLSNMEQNLWNAISEKGHQDDELDIIIQEKESKLEELNQSTLQSVTTLFEANLIAVFLVSPKGLDDDNLDKLVGLMVALRQKRLGVGPKRVRDTEGNVICQCLVPVIANLDNSGINMDNVRERLALHLMPLVKDKFVPILQHQIDLTGSHTSGETDMLHKLGYQV